MDLNAVGVYLEKQGLSDNEIDDFFKHHNVERVNWGVYKLEDPVDKVLRHFGVPGMKWGRRKASGPPSRAERKKQLYDVTARNNRVQRRVATGAAFIATNIIASGVAKKAGLNKKFVVSAVVLGTASVNSALKVHGAKKLADI
jgi:hypothetical protein